MGGSFFLSSPPPLPLLDFKSLAWVQSLADVVFFYHSFSFLSFLFPSTCISFFPLLLLSSSNFFLPFLHAFLPFFIFSYSFSFFFTSCFPLSATVLFLVPPFPNFFLLFLSSLFLIIFVFSFSPLNFFLVLPLYQGGCYEHKG